MKTPVIVLTLYLSLSHSDLDSSMMAPTEKDFKASKEFVEKLSQLGEKLATQNKVKVAVQLLSEVDKFLPLIGFTAPLDSFFFALVEQEATELKYIKEKFVNVNNKLTSISNKIEFLESNAVDQNNIVNSWGKLNELMQSIEIGMSAEARVRLADQFLSFYETTATEKSVANLHKYVTERNLFNLNKNLLTHTIEKTSGDMGALKDTSIHLSMLIVAGLRLNLYYYQTKQHTKTASKVEETIKKLSNFQRALQDAVEECANAYEKWAKEEAQKVIAETSSSDDKMLAKNIRKKLNEKFDWFVWSVIIHDIQVDSKYCQGRGRSIDLKHSNKRIHMIALVEVGVKRAPLPFQGICSRIRMPEDMSYIHYGNVEGGHSFKCSYDTKSRGASIPTLRMSAFFSAKPSAPSCSGMCDKKQCVQLKDSNEQFCKCQGMYYGPACKDRVDL